MEERFPTESAGLLLSKIGLLIILGCLLLAAWNGQIAIAILLGLVLAAAGFSQLWSRFSLVGVSCQRLLSEQRAFPGESIELKLQLSNRKLLPLPWIQVDDEIPVGFAPNIPTTPDNRPGFGFLSKAAAMLWYSKISWKSRLYCHKRGYYRLGPLTITSGDIFGFYPRSITTPLIDYIIVYPKIFPISQCDIPSLYPLGDVRSGKRIFEDPTRIMGVRDYSPHDSLRRIHWKATARQQSLQVKVFEPTTTLDVAIFLAVDSFSSTGILDDDFELGISTAASITNYVIDKGSPTGLFVNTRQSGSGQPVRILPGSTPLQLITILEALAKVRRISISPFEEFLNEERRYLPWGTTLITIVYELSEPMKTTLSSLKESGYKLLIYEIGKQGAVKAQDSIAGNYTPETNTFYSSLGSG